MEIVYDRSQKLRIFFGTRHHAIIPAECQNFTAQSVLTVEPFATINRSLQCETFFSGRQVHGSEGFCVDNMPLDTTVWTVEGDFLITNTSQKGLIVFTADCIPLVLYDPVAVAVAVVHAGWKGAVEGVIEEAINALRVAYSTNPVDLHIFIGPCAQVCCYQVSPEFSAQVQEKSHFSVASFGVFRDGQAYFDLLHYCKKRLFLQGVVESNVEMRYSLCTICTDRYKSHRADGGAPERNITVVSLK